METMKSNQKVTTSTLLNSTCRPDAFRKAQGCGRCGGSRFPRFGAGNGEVRCGEGPQEAELMEEEMGFDGLMDLWYRFLPISMLYP